MKRVFNEIITAVIVRDELDIGNAVGTAFQMPVVLDPFSPSAIDIITVFLKFTGADGIKMPFKLEYLIHGEKAEKTVRFLISHYIKHSEILK